MTIRLIGALLCGASLLTCTALGFGFDPALGQDGTHQVRGGFYGNNQTSTKMKRGTRQETKGQPQNAGIVHHPGDKRTIWNPVKNLDIGIERNVGRATAVKKNKFLTPSDAWGSRKDRMGGGAGVRSGGY
jgi:hypothetical protein